MQHGRQLKLAMIMALGAAAGAAQAADDAHARWSPIKGICMDSHNSTDWAAGVSIETLSIDNPGADAKAWEDAERR
jgi:hypothetical protein